MRTIMVSRRMLGWLGLLATVAVAGCTATSTSSPAAPDRSASPAATTAVSPRATSGSAPAGPGGVRNLAVNREVRNELTAAYADYRGISPADVAGTRPGSVYYAYDPATYTYWAQADFAPSSTASPGDVADVRRQQLGTCQLAPDALPEARGVRLRRHLGLGGAECRSRSLRAAHRVHGRGHRERPAPLRPVSTHHLPRHHPGRAA